MEKFKITDRTISSWIKTGKFLLPHKIGGRNFWLVSEVEEFVKNQGYSKKEDEKTS